MAAPARRAWSLHTGVDRDRDRAGLTLTVFHAHGCSALRAGGHRKRGKRPLTRQSRHLTHLGDATDMRVRDRDRTQRQHGWRHWRYAEFRLVGSHRSGAAEPLQADQRSRAGCANQQPLGRAWDVGGSLSVAPIPAPVTIHTPLDAPLARSQCPRHASGQRCPSLQGILKR